MYSSRYGWYNSLYYTNQAELLKTELRKRAQEDPAFARYLENPVTQLCGTQVPHLPSTYVLPSSEESISVKQALKVAGIRLSNKLYADFLKDFPVAIFVRQSRGSAYFVHIDDIGEFVTFTLEKTHTDKPEKLSSP